MGFDLDEKAKQRTMSKIMGSEIYSWYKKHVSFNYIQSNFSNLLDYVEKNSIDLVLVDLGLSQHQLKLQSKGFSYKEKESKLDMRLDPRLAITAADLLNKLPKPALEKIFIEYSELSESDAQKFIRAIVSRRNKSKIETTTDLNLVIDQNLISKKNLAQIYQGLRIAVNVEYENLADLLEDARFALKKSGKLIVITFHSGEEKIVKNYYKNNKSKWSDLSEKTPSNSEILENSSSRSARFYCLTY
jgi:16S rRNA (cytosine1402-N4)-methyltransferase